MDQLEEYSFQPHSFNQKTYHWPMCSRCGLVRLKNQLTEWCVVKGCLFDLHPAYKPTVKVMTRR